MRRARAAVTYVQEHAKNDDGEEERWGGGTTLCPLFSFSKNTSKQGLSSLLYEHAAGFVAVAGIAAQIALSQVSGSRLGTPLTVTHLYGRQKERKSSVSGCV
mgnify:CR=1 FL=1